MNQQLFKMNEFTPMTQRQLQKIIVELEEKSHLQEIKLDEVSMKLENHIICTNIWKHYKTKEEKKQRERKTLYQQLLDNKQLEETLTKKTKDIIDQFLGNSDFQLKFIKQRMKVKRNKSQTDQNNNIDDSEFAKLGNNNKINGKKIQQEMAAMIKYKTLAHKNDYVDINIDQKQLEINNLKISNRDFTMIKKKLEEGFQTENSFNQLQQRIKLLEKELQQLNNNNNQQQLYSQPTFKDMRSNTFKEMVFLNNNSGQNSQNFQIPPMSKKKNSVASRKLYTFDNSIENQNDSQERDIPEHHTDKGYRLRKIYGKSNGNVTSFRNRMMNKTNQQYLDDMGMERIDENIGKMQQNRMITRIPPPTMQSLQLKQNLNDNFNDEVVVGRSIDLNNSQSPTRDHDITVMSANDYQRYRHNQTSTNNRDQQMNYIGSQLQNGFSPTVMQNPSPQIQVSINRMHNNSIQIGSINNKTQNFQTIVTQVVPQGKPQTNTSFRFYRNSNKAQGNSRGRYQHQVTNLSSLNQTANNTSRLMSSSNGFQKKINNFQERYNSNQQYNQHEKGGLYES
ncbi:UNKNOWN [Stylonychia lemnae]|uniref:Uncharacterized protein n=1 Tax=Stylonychia lemnae TaxID=5949 RepID=A0A078AAJ5_STYLE|nr:UNKNOWN [Stylonychia lemnae]|eukprot:CDW79234.1 UNKNOWN [Stylonychia lemnae]